MNFPSKFLDKFEIKDNDDLFFLSIWLILFCYVSVELLDP